MLHCIVKKKTVSHPQMVGMGIFASVPPHCSFRSEYSFMILSPLLLVGFKWKSFQQYYIQL